MGTSSAAEIARKAGPSASTTQTMKTLSQGVIGTTQAAGYSIDHSMAWRCASSTSVRAIRAAAIQSKRPPGASGR